LHQGSYFWHDPRRYTPCRTCHLHTTRQANTILQMKQKIKEKQNETIEDSNSNLATSTTHHNQTKELTTWLLNLSLDESIDNKSTKFEVQIKDPMKHS
jgi:heterodisulfide reductase subunit B